MTGLARLSGEVFVSHKLFLLLGRDHFPGGGPRITFGGNGLAAAEPVEFCLVQVWPEAEAVDRAHASGVSGTVRAIKTCDTSKA